MDRLSRALGEIQACLEEQRRERDEAVRHAAELEVTLESARELSGQREANLVDANTRLLGQVEELSATVARMHSQVSAQGDSHWPPPLSFFPLFSLFLSPSQKAPAYLTFHLLSPPPPHFFSHRQPRLWS